MRPKQLQKAQALSQRHQIPLDRALIHTSDLSEPDILTAQAALHRVSQINLADHPADPRLVDKIGIETCLTQGILPWRHVGAAVVIAVSDPTNFLNIQPALEAQFGPVLMALAPKAAIADALRHTSGAPLAARAETFLPARFSCRNWHLALVRSLVAIGVVTLIALTLLSPLATAFLCLGLVTLSVALTTLLRIVAAGLSLSRLNGDVARPDWDRVPIARLPTISLLVPMCQEESIAGRLVERLEQLEYPRELLDVCLVVEADDLMTQRALAAADLPHWMRQITVPQGNIRTKPRAMNYALDHCHGSIIGIYDAEDAPARDQLQTVVRRFHSRGPNVACLQGVLDFYNRDTNWLSRCFTIDYAGWFRVMLPAFQRFGWALPLGGTTVFLRRDALEKLGRWDAHNVTEDADLGIRLARHGYRTEMIPTITEEECNYRAWPWIKQRTRWMKGYAVTYAVHMRHPHQLLQELGLWRFFGFQMLFAASLCQILLAPLLWTFWLALFGLPHPLADAMGRELLIGFAALMFTAELASISVSLCALRSRRLRFLRPWVPLVHVYAMMGSIAAWKAMAEIVHRPYHWDKTRHGVFVAPKARRFIPRRRRRRRA